MTRIVALAFTEQPGTPMRWLCGVVVQLPNGCWEYRELHRRDYIACPMAAIPTGELVKLKPYLEVTNHSDYQGAGST